MHLDKLLKQPQALPSAPKVVRQLIETFDQEDVDAMRVASLIEDDPVLTARVLKTANSAFFGLTRNVANAREAINVLGLIKVRALVIAASLGEGFHTVGGVNLNQFWRYSLNTANLSRYIALPIRIDENTAFTAGLIHGIGILIMHIAMPDELGPVDMGTPPLDLQRASAEMAAFGYSYAEVGAGMVEKWQFPPEMVSALANQVSPFEGEAYDPLAGLLHLASWRARAEELQLDNNGLAATFPDMVGLTLGLDLDSVLGKDPSEWSFSQALGAFVD